MGQARRGGACNRRMIRAARCLPCLVQRQPQSTRQNKGCGDDDDDGDEDRKPVSLCLCGCKACLNEMKGGQGESPATSARIITSSICFVGRTLKFSNTQLTPTNPRPSSHRPSASSRCGRQQIPGLAAAAGLPFYSSPPSSWCCCREGARPQRPWTSRALLQSPASGHQQQDSDQKVPSPSADQQRATEPPPSLGGGRTEARLGARRRPPRRPRSRWRKWRRACWRRPCGSGRSTSILPRTLCGRGSWWRAGWRGPWWYVESSRGGGRRFWRWQ